jgi:leucyl aminopeptidase
MTSDMAGAAAVIATVCLVAELGLPVEVTATVPIAENLPERHRLPPCRRGDLPQRQEGRDHQHRRRGPRHPGRRPRRAAEDSPDAILETSTLTGAQLVALGSRTAGVMGSDDLRDAVVAASARSGEAMWAMPMPAELRRGLDSPIADFVNANADRMGGMLVGAHFLAEFVPAGVPWAHIDIAARATTPARRGATRPRAAPASRCARC